MVANGLFRKYGRPNPGADTDRNKEDLSWCIGNRCRKLPGLHVGRTGLTQQQAEAAGYEVVTVLVPTDDKAHYYPGAGFFITKLIAEKETHKLLGVQVLGTGAVDKMVDIAVMGLNMGAVLEDFENADFAYAPPFSTAIHPFVQAVHVLLNKINGALVSMTPAEYAAGKAKGYKVIDAGLVPSIHGDPLCRPFCGCREKSKGWIKKKNCFWVCAKGKRA